MSLRLQFHRLQEQIESLLQVELEFLSDDKYQVFLRPSLKLDLPQLALYDSQNHLDAWQGVGFERSYIPKIQQLSQKEFLSIFPKKMLLNKERPFGYRLLCLDSSYGLVLVRKPRKSKLGASEFLGTPKNYAKLMQENAAQLQQVIANQIRVQRALHHKNLYFNSEINLIEAEARERELQHQFAHLIELYQQEHQLEKLLPDYKVRVYRGVENYYLSNGSNSNPSLFQEEKLTAQQQQIYDHLQYDSLVELEFLFQELNLDFALFKQMIEQGFEAAYEFYLLIAEQEQQLISNVEEFELRKYLHRIWTEYELKQKAINLPDKQLAYYLAMQEESIHSKFRTHELLGYLFIHETVDIMDIDNIAVNLRWRGNKLADLLMTFALELGKTLHVDKLMLEVRKGNQAARSLYEKYGFKQISVRRNYYSSSLEAGSSFEDAIIYECSLFDF